MAHNFFRFLSSRIATDVTGLSFPLALRCDQNVTRNCFKCHYDTYAQSASTSGELCGSLSASSGQRAKGQGQLAGSDSEQEEE